MKKMKIIILIVIFSGCILQFNVITAQNVFPDTGFVGIGVLNPAYPLDINGNVRISQNLYVGGGIIISDKVNATQELKSAALRADSIIMDSTKAFYGYSKFIDDVKLENKLKVNGDVQVNGIFKSFGDIISTGNITANCVNTSCLNVAGQISFDSLHVNKKIKVGNSVIIDAFGLENNIYTDNGDLKINSTAGLNYNTILNSGSNQGMVGIGTFNPNKKLHLYSANNSECGTSLRLEYFFNGTPNGCSNSSLWDITASGEAGSFLNFSTPLLGDPLLVLSNDGKVGIGSNTNLSERLNVLGYGKFFSNAGYTTIGFNGAHGYLNSSDALLINYYTGKDVIVGGTTGNFVAVNNVFLATNTNNNVGIGTMLPSKKLTVEGGSIRPAFGNSADAGIYFPTDIGGGGGDEAFIRYYVESGENTKFVIGTGNDLDDDISFYQAGAERLTINNGFVGIGTTTPMSALQVGAGSSKFSIGNSSGVDLGYGTSYIGFNASRLVDNTWKFNSDGIHNGGAVISNSIGGDIYFIPVSSNNGSSDISYSDAQLMSYKAMMISSNGKVGIGTSQLDANSILTVNGKIKAEEIEVVFNILPDYVFDIDYSLMTLKELENYIFKNKHLPEVPTAEFVKNNGLQLGEMNALLLKKVEEQTLYIIGLNKRIDNLEKLILSK